MSIIKTFGDHVYKCRISANVMYRDEFLFEMKDMIRFPIGVEHQLGRMCEEVIKERIVGLGLEVQSIDFSGVGEAFYIGERDGLYVHEHNLIMTIVVDDSSELECEEEIIGMSHDEVELSEDLVPTYWNRVVESEDFEFYLDKKQHTKLENTEQLLFATDDRTFAIEVAVIHRNKNQVYMVFDKEEVKLPSCLLNYNQTLGECLQSLVPVDEEDLYFVGVSENISDTHHRLTYIYEIDAPINALSNGSWVKEEELSKLSFVDNELKEILIGLNI